VLSKEGQTDNGVLAGYQIAHANSEQLDGSVCVLTVAAFDAAGLDVRTRVGGADERLSGTMRSSLARCAARRQRVATRCAAGDATILLFGGGFHIERMIKGE